MVALRGRTLAVGVLAAAQVALPAVSARAEVIYDPKTGATEVQAAPVGASADSIASQGVPVEQAQSSPPSDVELLENARKRKEKENEEFFKKRLESLRLQDEQRRLNELLGEYGEEGQAPTRAPSAATSDEVRISQASPAEKKKEDASPSATVVVAAQPAPASTSSERVRFVVQPRGGIGGYFGGGDYTASGQFVAGANLGVAFTDHLGLEVGYSYGDYNVSGSITNSYLLNYVAWQTARGYKLSPMTFKQNVFDGGLKIHLLDTDNRVRPYVTLGVGYSRGFVNYSQSILSYLSQYGLKDSQGKDAETSSFLGSAGVGLEVALTKYLSIGGAARVYKVLSARVSAPATVGYSQGSQYGYTGYGTYPYGSGYYPYGGYSTTAYPMDTDKQSAASLLATKTFYVANVAMTLTF